MEQVTQTVTLECAGNGRGFYAPKAAGIQWEHGAVGTGVWKGVRLADVLRMARPRPAARHVVPNGHDGPPTPQAPDFIRSHPLWKALEPHTIIALELNGKAGAAPARRTGAPHRAGLGRLGLHQVADRDHAGPEGVGRALHGAQLSLTASG